MNETHCGYGSQLPTLQVIVAVNPVSTIEELVACGIRRLLARQQLLRTVLVVSGLALAVSGCADDSADEGSSTSAEAGNPTVLATTGIWSDIVSNVACGGIADVETIIPVGGDPHGFEPSLRDRERMENAALVVANGLDLEERLEDIFVAVERSGAPVFKAAEQIEAIPFSLEIGEHQRDETEEGHRSGGDPHIWFDPQRVSGVLLELASRLIADVGLDADAVEACLGDYQAELAAVDAEIGELVERLPVGNRKLVTNHDALGYFADRYGFKIIGTVIPSPVAMSETNPAQLQELAETIEHEGVGAIFAETLHSTDDAEALASRVGDIKVVTLYTGSLGPPGSGAEDYVNFMRTNAHLIVDALG